MRGISLGTGNNNLQIPNIKIINNRKIYDSHNSGSHSLPDIQSILLLNFVDITNNLVHITMNLSG